MDVTAASGEKQTETQHKSTASTKCMCPGPPIFWRLSGPQGGSWASRPPPSCSGTGSAPGREEQSSGLSALADLLRPREGKANTAKTLLWDESTWGWQTAATSRPAAGPNALSQDPWAALTTARARAGAWTPSPAAPAMGGQEHRAGGTGCRWLLPRDAPFLGKEDPKAKMPPAGSGLLPHVGL